MNAEQQHPFPANKGKKLSIKTGKGIYTQYPIKTQFINSNEGVFYKICGYNTRAIDGPCEYTFPP